MRLPGEGAQMTDGAEGTGAETIASASTRRRAPFPWLGAVAAWTLLNVSFVAFRSVSGRLAGTSLLLTYVSVYWSYLYMPVIIASLPAMEAPGYVGDIIFTVGAAIEHAVIVALAAPLVVRLKQSRARRRLRDVSGEPKAAETGYSPRSRRKRLLAAASTVLLVVANLAAGVIWLRLYPAIAPGRGEVSRARSAIEAHAAEQWGGRVAIERLDVEMHDYPGRSDYAYHAYFRVRGTDALFYAAIPRGDARIYMQQGNYMLTSKLTTDEVGLLVAYSRETSVPAMKWGTGNLGWYMADYPEHRLWYVESLTDPRTVENNAMDVPRYLFGKRGDGTFEFLKRIDYP